MTVRCVQAFFINKDGETYTSASEAVAYICPHCSDTHLAILTGDTKLYTVVAMKPEDAESLARELTSPPTFEGILS